MSHYTFDLQGRYAGLSDTVTERSTTLAPPALTPEWNWNGVNWIFAPSLPAASIAPAAPAPVARTLTRLEYMSRFTDTELAGIYTAAKAVIQVEIWLEKFKLAGEINLDDPATIGGLQAMEAGGLLAAGRSVEILA